MNSDYLILLARNKEEQYKQLAETLSDYNISLLYCKNNGIDLRLNVIRHKPFAVIFDSSELGMQDIIDVIEECRDPNGLPIFYNIYTYEDSERIKQLEESGVHFNVPTPYNSSAIAGHLKLLCQNIPVDEREFCDDIRSEIHDIMLELCISPSRTSWNYIMESIMCLLFSGGGRFTVCRSVYEAVASKLDVSISNMERSIRTAVEGSWKNAPEGVKQKYFPEFYLTARKPKNMDFIYRLAEYVYRQHKGLFNKYYDSQCN